MRVELLFAEAFEATGATVGNGAVAKYIAE